MAKTSAHFCFTSLIAMSVQCIMPFLAADQSLADFSLLLYNNTVWHFVLHLVE